MLLIAHRGASGYAPENTISSFNKAVEMGSKAIEFDVQMTKDEEIVVIHDYTVNRTTGGNGYVKNSMLDDLKKLDAGAWFDNSFKGEKIPTLQEVLETLPEDIFLNIEIKQMAFDYRNIEKKVLSLLQKYNRVEKALISSFNHNCLKKMKKLDKDIRTALLISSNLLNPCEYVEANHLDLYSINQSKAFISEELVCSAKENGYKVYCYTVNDSETARFCEAIGIDAIFTNYPDIHI